MAEKKWLTVKETSALLSLSTKTVYCLIERGELPFCRVGGSIRINRVRLEGGMEKQVEMRTK